MWQLYMIRCGDGSLYTGITTDVPRRLGEHTAGNGAAAKYLRGRAPLSLAWCCTIGSRTDALRIERRIKKLGKPDKERLAAGVRSLADLGLL